MANQRIHFIGGEKGGVGKSVVSRLLAQYWIDQERPWKGFDTDRSHGALLRYYPGFAEPVDTSRIEQLDRIMEAAMEAAPNVLVDLAAQTESQLHDWIEDGGLLDMSHDLGLDLRFWYVMDDGKDSVNLLTRLLDRHGEQGRYVIVLNHGRGDDFSLFHASPVAARVEELQIPLLSLRALHKPTMRKIDQFDKSFWAAVNNTDPAQGDCLSMMERQRVKVWLRHAYGEFSRVDA